VRIGSMDLKIACVALAHDATLLTRNTTDFAQIAGLRIENWVD
jgi:tRNA(fMet)-specific endonuclease VapC